MIKGLLVAILILAVSTRGAMAEFSLRELESTATKNELLFEGYVAGAVEAGIAAGLICPRHVMTFAEVSKLVRNQMRKLSMEQLNATAAYFILFTGKSLFPCGRP